MALKHKKQLLGLDLNQINHHDAAAPVVSWIQLDKMKILNVAGPKVREFQAFTGTFIGLLRTRFCFFNGKIKSPLRRRGNP